MRFAVAEKENYISLSDHNNNRLRELATFIDKSFTV